MRTVLAVSCTACSSCSSSPCSSPSSPLPPELHTHVAAHLARADLVSFALASRAFAVAAQARLFRHLLLHHRTPRERAAKIFGTLAGNDKLCRYVKSFAVEWNMLDETDAGAIAELAADALKRMYNLTFLSLSSRAVVAPDTYLPALRILQAAIVPPHEFLVRHAGQLTHLALLTPDDGTTVSNALLPPMPLLKELTTTAELTETLLAYGPSGQQLQSLTVHARDKSIAFPSSPFFTLLATAVPGLNKLWMVDWRPPSHSDPALPAATPHTHITTLGLYLTYCYCVADMACPHGAYVWETFVQSAVKIVPNVEVLEFPCAPELAAAGEEEHARPSLPLEVWKAPEAYAKHMTRLRQVNLGNGLSYVRTPKDDGFAFVCVDGEALDTPYLCLPAHLRHLVDDQP